MVFTVYVPTNRGLQYVRAEGIKFLQKKFPQAALQMCNARGENIPEIVAIKSCDINPVFGITGGDLLQEYYVRTKPDKAEERIKTDLIITTLGLEGKGSYQNTVFGLPALCILGKGGMDLDCLVSVYFPEFMFFGKPNFQGKKVAIPKRYEQLINFEVDLSKADVLALDGKVDVTAAKGIADYAIDIVLTGTTCKEQGLGIFQPPLFFSDGVVLGNYAARRMMAPKLQAQTLKYLNNKTGGEQR